MTHPDENGRADEESPADPTKEDEQGLFEVLDAYANAIQAGRAGESSRLLADHPEQRDLLRCLESLDRIAAPRAALPEPDSSTTLPMGSVVTDAGDAAPLGRFGDYDLLEELGRGGMGVVLRARQRDLDRDVALKMILASHLASPEEVRRFLAEARLAARLRHPHVIAIHEVGQVGGQHYFTMDYVSGRSLAEVLEDERPAPRDAARLSATIARAVHYLHENGIVHRDLKPSNVIVDGEGAPYVTDFGLAKAFQGDGLQTRTGTIVGTASYMAPEQAAGRNENVTARTDVYGLGALLYEMLTGRPPFRERSPLDTIVQVIEGEPAPPRRLNPTAPRDLERICLRCLEKNPDDRYPTAAAVAEDLERYLRDEPVDVGGRSVWHRLQRWSRREPALAFRLLGIAFAAIIIQTRYTVLPGERWYHARVMGLLGVWAAVSFVFQWMLRRRDGDLARFGWVASDVLLLTGLLFIADGPIGPLLVGYPLIVAATGLLFRVRLVVFTTVVSLVGYASLVLLRRDPVPVPIHYPIVFGSSLAIIGGVVAYQVRRVKVLSRYYDDRRLP